MQETWVPSIVKPALNIPALLYQRNKENYSLLIQLNNILKDGIVNL